MEAKLVVIGGKANMGEVKLRLPMTIGRGHKADLMISHPTVSREHCRLFEKNGELVVQDNNSSNGTFVDGEKIAKAAVVLPGQILAIGPLTFRAEYEGPTARTSRKKQTGELADTQAMEKEELDLDFLLSDDPAPPAAGKPKAEKAIEAKSPAVPAKSGKSASTDAKDKTQVAPAAKAPAKGDRAKSPAIGPPNEVKDTAAVDVDFFEDLADEQKQAPAATDTSAIDFSDLGIDEPAAKAPPEKRPSSKKQADDPKTSAELFEQTIDFTSDGGGEADASGGAAVGDLPSDDIQPGDIDFDFLSDLGSSESRDVASTTPTPTKKSAPPEAAAEPPMIVPPVDSAATLDDDVDFDELLGELEAKRAPEPQAVVESPAIEDPVAAETSTVPDAVDFLADLDLAAPSVESPAIAATTEPEAKAPSVEREVVPPAAEESVAEPPISINADQPARTEAEFDFSALDETQELAALKGPESAADAAATSQEPPTVEVSEHVAMPSPAVDAGDEDIDFGFLDAEPKAAISENAGEPETNPPVVESAVFESDMPADPLSKESPAAKESVEPAAAETPSFVEPVSAAPEATSPDAKSTQAADDFDLLSKLTTDIHVGGPTSDAPAVEQPQFETPLFETSAVETPHDFENLDVTLNFGSAEDAAGAAEPDFGNIAESEEPPRTKAPGTPMSAADEFDFLAELSDESSQQAVDQAPAAETPAALEEFEFTSPAEPPAASQSGEPQTRDPKDATAMFMPEPPTASESPAATDAGAPAAETTRDFGVLKESADRQSAASADADETAMFTSLEEPVAAAPVSNLVVPSPMPEAGVVVPPELSVAPPAESTIVASSSAKQPAAKKPSLLETIKLLFTGSKGTAKPPKTKEPVKMAAAVPSKPTYQPVMPGPSAPIDAPIPLDDAPIPLDDVGPAEIGTLPSFDAASAATPAESIEDEATAMFTGAVEEFSIESSAAETSFADNAAPAAETPSAESPPPAASVEDNLFDDFLADTAPTPPKTAAETPAESDFAAEPPPPQPPTMESPISEAPSSDPASIEANNALEIAFDPLEADMLAEEKHATAELIHDQPAAPSESFSFELDAETSAEVAPAGTDQSNAESPLPFEQSEAISAAAPVETPTMPAARRPASVDVDLRMTSSLRPLARLNVIRPRFDTPQLEPEEPSGRSFAPRAKQPSSSSESSLSPPPEDRPAADAASAGASFESFDLGESATSASDAPNSEQVAGEDPRAELQDSDFDFLTKEQEAEASIEAPATPSAETIEATAAEPSNEEPLFGDLDLTESSNIEAMSPSPEAAEPPTADEEEFILMLDDVDAPTDVDTAGTGAALVETPKPDVSAESIATDDGEFGFLADAAPPAEQIPTAANPSQEPVDGNGKQPGSAPHVAVKKDADADLDDFFRDLGIN